MPTTETNQIRLPGNRIYDLVDSAAREGLITTLYEEIIYSQLVSKVNNSQLVKGRLYRITDYITTVNSTVQNRQNNPARSTGYPFDLVVLAIDDNKLDCQAAAILHSGDTYFSASGNTCDLSKWEIWYDIENDTNKYEWADSDNGRGVIYRMIDDLGNDCPYDFKNIQFKRKLNSNGRYDPTTGTDTWIYTFSLYTSGNISDSTLIRSNYVRDNIQKEDKIGNKIVLNDNVFIGTKCYDNTFGYYCRSNTFQEMCVDNTFMDSCSGNYGDGEFGGNTFGDGCFDNTFGYAFSGNTFKNRCDHNTFGNYCYSNNFGDDCGSNTFGDDCNYNSFGDDCGSNTFGDDCNYNSFGNYCYSNNFGNGCNNNIFEISCTGNHLGNYCDNNTLRQNCSYNSIYQNCDDNTLGKNCNSNIFKDYCVSNTLGDNCIQIKFGNQSGNYGTYCRYNIFENGCSYINLYNSGLADSSRYLQNVYIAQGVSGTSSNYIDIGSIQRNIQYRITVAKFSNGILRIYKEDEDDINVQANWNESNSSSPAYIQNKPDLLQSYNITTSSVVDTHEKIDGFKVKAIAIDIDTTKNIYTGDQISETTIIPYLSPNNKHLELKSGSKILNTYRLVSIEMIGSGINCPLFADVIDSDIMLYSMLPLNNVLSSITHVVFKYYIEISHATSFYTDDFATGYTKQGRAVESGYSNWESYITNYLEDVDAAGANPYTYTGNTFVWDGDTYYLWEFDNASGESSVEYMLTDTINYQDLYNNSIEADHDNEYCPYVALLSYDQSLYRENNQSSTNPDWLVKVTNTNNELRLWFDDFIDFDLDGKISRWINDYNSYYDETYDYEEVMQAVTSDIDEYIDFCDNADPGPNRPQKWDWEGDFEWDGESYYLWKSDDDYDWYAYKAYMLTEICDYNQLYNKSLEYDPYSEYVPECGYLDEDLQEGLYTYKINENKRILKVIQ